MSLAPLNPIQMLPARDRVAAALREAILSHQFAEGEELTLKDTAAQLGVSSTPIREAFQMLAREGLIELRPNRGAIVLGMNEKRLRDHYETRAALERAAVVLVCRKKADIGPIKLAYVQAASALAQNDSEGYSAQNQAFHMAIWTAADNDAMKELLSSLWNAPHGVRSCRRNLRVGRPVWVGLFYSDIPIRADSGAILPITSH